VKGKWVYLYRAVDAFGQTIDFLLSPKRDAAAARRFFRKALGQPHTVNPRTITVDKNAAFPIAAKAMKQSEELWRFAKLRLVKFLNNIVEQDHRHIKRLVRPGLGFKSFMTASRTIAGYEIMAMVRKGQVASVPANDMRARATSLLLCSALLRDLRHHSASDQPTSRRATEPQRLHAIEGAADAPHGFRGIRVEFQTPQA
jgi:transposase, IS6 family